MVMKILAGAKFTFRETLKGKLITIYIAVFVVFLNELMNETKHKIVYTPVQHTSTVNKILQWNLSYPDSGFMVKPNYRNNCSIRVVTVLLR